MMAGPHFEPVQFSDAWIRLGLYFFIIRYTRDRAIELFETFEHRAERFPTISMITFTIAVQTFAVSRLLEAFRWMKKLEIFFKIEQLAN